MKLLPALVAASLVARAQAPPSKMIWAWERPTDLRALPSSFGVAFIAATLDFASKGLHIQPRFDAMRAAPQAYRMAVVRIEDYRRTTPDDRQRRQAVDAIVDVLAATGASALQIDFDAAQSKRAFYAALLRDVRARIGPSRFLSMTALVSWCERKSWIDDLPVDEVVPMTFDMGGEQPSIETLLRSGGKLANPRCASSIGIAAAQFDSRPGNYARTYVFSHQGWTPDLIETVRARLK